MNDFIVDAAPLETPESSAAQDYANAPPTAARAFGAMFGETSVIGALARADERSRESISEALDDTGGEFLSAEDANRLYAPEGAKITDKPMSAGMAKIIGRQKQEEMDRENILSRYAGSTGALTRFGMGTAAFLADPLNLASVFVPGLGEEAVGEGLARIGLQTSGALGRAATRAVAGATGATAGQVPLTALRYGLGTQEASDYDLRSAMKDLAFAAAGGAVLHAGFGAVGDAIRARRTMPGNFAPPAGVAPAPPGGEGPPGGAGTAEDIDAEALLNANAATRHEAMSSAVSEVVTGRPVDVTGTIGAAAPYRPDLSNRAAIEPVRAEARLSGMTIGDARAATKEFAKRELQGKHLSNDDTGWDDIRVSRDTIDKATSAGHSWVDFEALHSLPDLMRRATLVESYADRLGNPDLRGVHRLYAPFELEGKTYRAKITVKSTAPGRRIYDVTNVEIEGPGAQMATAEALAGPPGPNPGVITGEGASAEALPAPGPPGRGIDIRRLLNGVNYEDGTPLFSEGSGPLKTAKPAAEIAQNQQQLYRDGFAGGLTQDELLKAEADLLGENEAPEEGAPEPKTERPEGGAPKEAEADPELEALEKAHVERVTGGATMTAEERAELDSTAAAISKTKDVEAAANQAAQCLMEESDAGL